MSEPSIEHMESLEKAGKYFEALRGWLELKSRFPEKTVYIFKIGHCYTKLGLFESSEEVYTEAIKKRPNSIILYIRLAHVARLQNNESSGGKWIDKALEIKPEHPGCLWFKGQGMIRSGEISEAKIFFEKNQDILRERTKLGLAQACITQKDWTNSIEFCSHTFQNVNTGVQAKGILHSIYLRLNRIEDAKVIEENLIEKFPDRKIGFEKKVQTHVKLKEYEEAIKSIQIFEEKFGFQYSLAMIKSSSLISIMDYEKAHSLLQELMTNFPNLNRAYIFLSRIHVKSGNFKSSIETLVNFLIQNPKDTKANIALGKVYLDIHDFKSAIHSFQRANDLNPHDESISKILSHILFLNDQKDLAIKTLSKSLKFRPHDQKIKFKKDLLIRTRNNDLQKEPINDSKTQINIGILDYNVDTFNIGDYIQTLAIVNYLAKFKLDLSPTSYERFGQLLKNFVDNGPSDRIFSSESKINIIPILRDNTSLYKDSGPIWVFMNGWFMHKEIDPRIGDYCFPPPANIRPIFTSFHLNEFEILSKPGNVNYLKKYEPIGCRDLWTMNFLKSAGVKSFFSGCLTLTLDLFEPVEKKEKTFIVDCNPAARKIEKLNSRDVSYLSHIEPSLIADSTEGILLNAYNLLKSYKEAKQVFTSRLHCYLPCRALNIPAEFLPSKPMDIRFTGLAPIGDKKKEIIRNNFSNSIKEVIKRILENDSEESIYATWRRMNTEIL